MQEQGEIHNELVNEPLTESQSLLMCVVLALSAKIIRKLNINWRNYNYQKLLTVRTQDNFSNNKDLQCILMF